jgi:xanthine dehydrogenase accessory factor
MTDSDQTILDRVPDLKASGEAFALATVVRTVAATAAKPGAKALIRADGTITDGWIGGNCVRAAVSRAAKEAIADGQPRLVSIQPEDLLDESGITPGEERDGIRFARNMCPSKGTMDVFVEPVLPKPELLIFGASPVAVALAELGGRFEFTCTVCAPAAGHDRFNRADRMVDGFGIENAEGRQRYVVVATQGQGDMAALRAAVDLDCRHLAFVGSRRKASALGEKLLAEGKPEDRVAALHAPAGLDIGAITPDEIALSILAQIVDVRRKSERAAVGPNPS